jgi:hypothetical protein
LMLRMRLLTFCTVPQAAQSAPARLALPARGSGVVEGPCRKRRRGYFNPKYALRSASFSCMAATLPVKPMRPPSRV